jgi:integrase
VSSNSSQIVQPESPLNPVQRFLASKSGASPRTVDTYRYILASYTRWNDDKMDISHEQYDRYIQDLVSVGRRPNGIRTASVVLSEYARSMGLDVSQWQRLKQRDVVRIPLHPNEFRDLIAACKRFPDGSKREFFFYFVTGTQLRIQEFLDLKWSDVDLVNRTLVVRSGKGGSTRRIRLFHMEREAAWARLRELYGRKITAEKARLIPDRVAPFNNKVQAQRWCTTTGQAAGLGVRHVHPHLLRHTGAVWLLKLGMNIRALQFRLGHKSLEVTSRYLQLTDQEMEAQFKDINFNRIKS